METSAGTASGACIGTGTDTGLGSESGARRGGTGIAVPARLRADAPLCGLLLGVGLLLTGCADAPVVRWHSLQAPPGAPLVPAAAPVGNAESAPAAIAPLVVDLSITRVPAEVEQPQWLVRLPDETMRLLESERWAAPLRDELRAALMQALIARWGVADARSWPPEPTIDAIRDTPPQAAPSPTAPGQPASGRPLATRPVPKPPPPPGDASTPLAAEQRRVTVDVTRFESVPERDAQLDAAWAITATGAAPQTGEPPMPVLVCRSTFREAVGSGAPALAAGHRRAVAALADAIGHTLRAGRGAACPPEGSGR